MPIRVNPFTGDLYPDNGGTWGSITGTLSDQTDLQTALDGKSGTAHTHLLAAGATDVTASATELNTLDGITATTTELNYTDGVTSAIQTQLDGKVSDTGDTMTGTLTVPTITMSNTTLGIQGNGTTGLTRVFGGTIGDGAGFVMGGSTNVSIPNQGIARVGGSNILVWNTTGVTPGTNGTLDNGSTTNYWKYLYATRYYLNSTTYIDGATAGVIAGNGIFTADNLKRGTGSPNGVVTANVGTVYIDTAVTNGASSWIKKSGTGNTGWSVLEGDTGWRDITSLSGIVTSGGIYIKRNGGTVSVMFTDVVAGTSSGTTDYFTQPTGFLPSRSSLNTPIIKQTGAVLRLLASTGLVRVYGLVSGDILNGQFSWDCTSVWPTTLPGTAA